MSFSNLERKRLAELADVLIPAGEGRLSASEADVGGSGLDQVLATSPEMADGLREVLALAGEADAEAAVALLSESQRGAFFILCEFAAGAYFLNAVVREAVGYAGQTARAIDPRADYLNDGLLESVVRRGAVYRPTPQ